MLTIVFYRKEEIEHGCPQSEICLQFTILNSKSKRDINIKRVPTKSGFSKLFFFRLFNCIMRNFWGFFPKKYVNLQKYAEIKKMYAHFLIETVIFAENNQKLWSQNIIKID